MNTFLLKLLELSLQAGALTLGILFVRLVFRKLPAKYFCLLWAIVAVRLVVPFSFETGFAWAPNLQTLWSGEEEHKYKEVYTEFIPIGDARVDYAGNRTEKVKITEIDESEDYYLNGSSKASGTVTDIYAELVEEHHTVISDADSINESDYYIAASPTPVPEGIANATFRLDWRALLGSVTPVLFVLWLLGIVILLGYGVFCCIRVKRLVKNTIPYEDNIWLCEDLQTPFLFGWRNPQIYLPTNMEEAQIQYVVEHEKAHIARGDNYTKIIGYMLLSVYWFNPLIWVAYVMFCKDVERACDERVIGGFSPEDRKGYAEALLECSVDRKFGISNPLAFGEMDVKKRITGILQYKKPGRWLIVIAMLLCLAAVAGCFFVKENKPKWVMGPSPTPKVTATPTPTVAPSSEQRGDGPYTPTPTVGPSSEQRGDGPYTPTPTPTPADYVWTQTVTHIPSDLEHVENDMEVIGYNLPETLVTVSVGQTATVDLNGDGADESVTYDVENLYINGDLAMKCGKELFGIYSPYQKYYYIFDVDLTDGYKELGLREMGPNGEAGIYLYRYDGEQMKAIGGFRNVPQSNADLSISVPGDGTIWTVDRDFLLETCNVVKKYQLENATTEAEAKLVQARRRHYVFVGWDSERGIETTAAKEFKAFVSDCLDDEEVVVVPEGSEITFYDYYLSAEEWGKGHVRFFYTVEEKWDSVGWLILSSDGIVMPRSSDTEPFGEEQPDELFHNLSHAG